MSARQIKRLTWPVLIIKCFSLRLLFGMFFLSAVFTTYLERNCFLKGVLLDRHDNSAQARFIILIYMPYSQACFYPSPSGSINVVTLNLGCATCLSPSSSTAYPKYRPQQGSTTLPGSSSASSFNISSAEGISHGGASSIMFSHQHWTAALWLGWFSFSSRCSSRRAGIWSGGGMECIRILRTIRGRRCIRFRRVGYRGVCWDLLPRGHLNRRK